MRATRNSKLLRNSRFIPAAVFVLLLAIGAAAAAWFFSHGYILYYGDAEAHLETARRIIDSRTPGYEQLGVPWLPLPHVLMLPFVGNDYLWQTGLAGTIPGVFCCALAGTFLFSAVRLLFNSTAASMCAALVLTLNPNMLYLQSTPMTEPVLLATFMGLLYFTVLFGKSQSMLAAAGAGIFALAATVTRYDGWFVLPFVALYLFIAGGRKRWHAAVLFCIIAGLGPLYWLAHNAIFEGDPLAFYRGPWSAKTIQGDKYYPGKHNITTAMHYYAEAARLVAGNVAFWVGLVGLLAALCKRAWWAFAFLLLAPVFYILSMYSSGNPIFLPHLWPNTYYNTRYGTGALPLLAFGAAAIVALLPPRAAKAAAALTVVAVLVPFLRGPDSWITWKESQVNSEVRRAWSARVANVLRSEYKPGAGILFSWGDMTGAIRQAGIPLRETLHIGNGPYFEGVIARPDLFLHEEWAIAASTDPVASAMIKTWRSGPRYQQVGLVYVPGGPPIEIHRRTHDNTLYQGARSAE